MHHDITFAAAVCAGNCLHFQQYLPSVYLAYPLFISLEVLGAQYSMWCRAHTPSDRTSIRSSLRNPVLRQNGRRVVLLCAVCVWGGGGVLGCSSHRHCVVS